MHVGEGVTYEVFLGILVMLFRMCAPADMPHQQSAHICLHYHDVTCRGMMSLGILVMSSHGITMTSLAYV